MAVGGGPLTVDYDTRRRGDGVFVVLALVVMGVCTWMAVLTRHEDPGFTFVLIAFGSVWLAIGGLIWVSATDPIRLKSGRFDDEQRSFVLTAADGTDSALPYRELEGFEVRRKVSTGKHSRVSFVVYLLKRDGGFWDLRSFGDDGLAAEMLRSLRGSVDLAAARGQGAERAAPLPAVFRRKNSGSVTSFTWRSQVRFIDSFCGILLGASIIGLLLGIVGVMTGAHTFFRGLAALVVAWIARRVYKASGRTFRLEISERLLTYSTRERGAVQFQVKGVLSLAEVSRLQSTYELELSQQERSHRLTFVGEQEAARLQARRLADRDRETVRDAMALNQAIIELDLPGIRTADVLKFEAHLQAELARRGQPVA
jgi:hypothetical protein